MTTMQSGSRTTSQNTSETAAGVTVTAALFMIMIGAFQAIEGIVALVNDTFYVVGTTYVFEFDTTTWGWIHLGLGVIAVLAGLALFQGMLWARVIAVIMASVSIVANFMWLPYYPLWSLTIIAFDVFVIWAVTMHPRAAVDG